MPSSIPTQSANISSVDSSRNYQIISLTVQKDSNVVAHFLLKPHNDVLSPHLIFTPHLSRKKYLVSCPRFMSRDVLQGIFDCTFYAIEHSNPTCKYISRAVFKILQWVSLTRLVVEWTWFTFRLGGHLTFIEVWDIEVASAKKITTSALFSHQRTLMDISSNAQKNTMLPFNLKQVFLITEGLILLELIENES